MTPASCAFDSRRSRRRRAVTVPPAQVAGALKADALLLLTDVPGVLDEAGDVLSELSAKDAERLVADGTVSGGMIPKLAAALDAMREGAKAARIVDGRTTWLAALDEDAWGTRIT